MPKFTTAQVAEVNRLAWNTDLTNPDIAAQLDIPGFTVNQIVEGKYVADIEDSFIPDSAITLELYETIRKEWKPRGPGAGINSHDEYALARKYLVKPTTILRIARSHFQNDHTHPSVAKAATRTDAKPFLSKPLTEADIRAALVKVRNFEPRDAIALVAEVYGLPTAIAAEFQTLRARRWRADDITIHLNRKYLVAVADQTEPAPQVKAKA